MNLTPYTRCNIFNGLNKFFHTISREGRKQHSITRQGFKIQNFNPMNDHHDFDHNHHLQPHSNPTPPIVSTTQQNLRTQQISFPMLQINHKVLSLTSLLMYCLFQCALSKIFFFFASSSSIFFFFCELPKMDVEVKIVEVTKDITIVEQEITSLLKEIKLVQTQIVMVLEKLHRMERQIIFVTRN